MVFLEGMDGFEGIAESGLDLFVYVAEYGLVRVEPVPGLILSFVL